MFDFFNDQNDVRSTTGISSETGISVDSLFCVFVPLSHAHTDEFQRGGDGEKVKKHSFCFFTIFSAFLYGPTKNPIGYKFVGNFEFGINLLSNNHH
jgi:hypothetical protein